MAPSNESSAIASSRVTDCAAFLLSSKRRSLTVPRRIESSTERTMSRSWSSAARMSRKAITSGKLCPVSICISGDGNFAGRKTFSARRSSTMESLPPENDSTGFAHSPATSRSMKIASDSSQSRWLRGSRAPGTARAVVCRQLGLGARDGRLAALAGDPGVLAVERAIERLHLADVAAALAQLLAFVERVAAETRDVFCNGAGIRPEHFHVVAVARADRADHVERVGVQPFRVEGEDFDFELVPQDDIGDHHVLGGEARGEDGRSVLERNAHQEAFVLCDPFRQLFRHVV